MRFPRLLAGLFLATSIACAPSSSSLRSSRASVEAPRPRDAGELRVMTFNIQSGLKGLDKVAGLIRSASPDIVALQEVDVGSRRARGLNQPAVLAERTGLPHHAHFRTTDLHGGPYGVALLSRFPLLSLEQHALPVPAGAEPRTVAHVVLDVEGTEVSVYVTHLTRMPFNSDVRLRQSVTILKLMEGDARPKLLLGDMNDTPDSRTVRLFKRELLDVFALSGQGSSKTHPLLGLLPGLRIDYVLACQRFMPRGSRVLRVKASDHYPVVADLALLEAPREPSEEVVRRDSPEDAEAATGSP
jgi:endonuclease/exonuclease/phosphatase family metal-dependent hydrolase